MHEVMKDYAGGDISQEEYYVKSKLAAGSTYAANFGSWTAYDEVHHKEATDYAFQFYSCQMDASITKNYKADGCLDGATIVVHGYAQLYQPAEGNPVFEICYLSAKKSPTGEAVSPVIISVEGGTEYVQPDATALSIGENFELTEGGTKKLTATFTPADGKHADVVWASSAAAVATVADGVVTAVAAGEATITATAGSLTASVTVTVKAAVAPTVTLDFSAAVDGLKAKADVTVGEAYTITMNNVDYTVLNGYQGAYNNEYYLMLNSKGFSAQSLFANATALGSAIKSVELTTRTGASNSSKFSVVVSDTAIGQATAVAEPTTIAAGSSQLFEFADNTTGCFFGITTETNANCQLVSIVITLAA
ncbi:MAG: Ig-like domain-containing protein [Bacilli bacterium]|nr:Ig-like domain-containing protein [Bacilli bacterium]